MATDMTPASGSPCTACRAGEFCAGGLVPRAPCPEKTWDDDGNPATGCVAKTTCSPGTYVLFEGSTIADRKCTACANGSYTSTINAPACLPWGTCPAGTHVVTMPGAGNNIQCAACTSGTFSASTNRTTCTSWSSCAAGTYVSAMPSSTMDRVCTDCAVGKYSTTHNQTACVDWTTCAAGQYISTAGTRTSDQTCSACPDGTWDADSDPTTACVADTTPPTIGTGIAFSETTTTSTTVSWGPASDSVTAAASLLYKLVRAATSAAIDTTGEANAITGGGLAMDWTADITSQAVSGLASSTTYYFAVLVKDTAGNLSLYVPASVTTLTPPDTTSPTVGTGITFSNVTSASMTVSWGAATDDVTAQASLQYKLVSGANSASIDTVAEADAATTMMSWSSNTLSKGLIGLTESTTYYVAVLVKDAAGNLSLYAPASQATLAATTLACSAGEVAVGLYGRAGWYFDRLGVRCATFDGTTLSATIVDGAAVGGLGGSAFTYDCPSGTALYAIRGGNSPTCSITSTSYLEFECKDVSTGTLQSWSAKYGEGGIAPSTCPHTSTFNYACNTGEYATGVKVDANGTGDFVGVTLNISCATFASPG